MLQPLSGIKVLDLSQFLSGPRAASILADLGAQVVKIEPLTGETMRLLCILTKSQKIMNINDRNKKSVVLDLKHPRGREIFTGLAEKADVIVENFTPGTMEKMGIGYEKLTELNGGLIYAGISGFGSTGRKRKSPAFDIIAQAASGIMHASKRPDRPPGVFFADLVSGAFCAMGILAALLSRGRDGRGQFIDISMQDVMYYHNFSAQAERVLKDDQEAITGHLGRPMASLFSDDSNPLPFWNVYGCRDGNMAVVAITDAQWSALLGALGLESLRDDARFSNFPQRIRNSREGVSLLAERMGSMTVQEALDRMSAAEVPCHEVADTAGVNRDMHLDDRGMFHTFDNPGEEGIAVPGFPVKLSLSPAQIRHAAPRMGEHTREVLREWLGMDDVEAQILKNEKICGF